MKVKTCFDNAGHVISAGAERLTSTLGVIPQDVKHCWHDRPYLAETGCYPRPDRPAMF